MDYFARPQSAAVRIVDPNAPQKGEDNDGVQRQCKNLLLYGYCRSKGKGCTYLHPSIETPTRTDSRASDTSSVTSNSLTSAAPEFVPKYPTLDSFPTNGSPATTPSPFIPAPDAPTFVPKSSMVSPGETQTPADYASNEFYGHDPFDSLNTQMSNMETQYYEPQYDYYSSAAPVFIRQPLNYHLYTPHLPPPKVDQESYFLPPKPQFFQQLRSKSETVCDITPHGSNLPEEIQGYHTLVQLEPTLPPNERRKVAGNWHTTTYRAINSNDGLPYCLVRIENYRLTSQDAFTHVEAWSKIKHPGLVTLCEAFTTRSFGDNSVVFVYEYYSEAKTLYDHHFKSSPPPSSSSTASSSNPYGHNSSSSSGKYNKHYNQIQREIHGLNKDTSTTIISERVIWSYIVQLASAMKTVHQAGRAIQMVDISRVILCGKNRVRFSTPGLPDVLTHSTAQQSDINHLQAVDLLFFGRLVFSLLTNNTVSMANTANFGKALEHITRNYSEEMKDVVVWLAGKGAGHGIGYLLGMIPDNVTREMDEALEAFDKVQHHLMSELENARLVRLLCKFGFINERPEFARDPRWSETGDRYILKLFRDYVFHQVDERGMPIVSLGHVLTCLNKLDAGTDEKIMLVARDEQSCLVVSYRDVKNCLDGAFRELTNPPNAASSASPGMGMLGTDVTMNPVNYISHYRT